MSFWDKANFHLPSDVNHSTLSNLGFLVVGVFAAALLGLPAVGWALSLSYLALASAWYHFNDRHEYTWSDWSAMYVAFSSQITYFAYLWAPNYLWLVLGFIIGGIISYFHEFLEKKTLFNIPTSFIAVGVLYTINLALSYIFIDWTFATISLISYATAFAFRQKAEQGGKYTPNFNQEYYDRVHSAWHWVVQVAMLFHVTGFYYTYMV